MDIKKTWLFTRPIAHRGLHTPIIPENSIGAFENAIKSGFAIELDVRLTDDGTVVVFHDDKLSRLTGRDGYVSTTSFSDLSEIYLLATGGVKTEWTIPTLEQVLGVINGRVPILIETKNDVAVGSLENKVIEILRNYSGEYAVQSFNPHSMEYFKINAREIPRGQLSKFFEKSEVKGKIKRSVLKKLKANKLSKPDFISYCADDLPNKYVSKTSLPVLAWTVRSNTDYERVKPFCNNIIFENFIPAVSDFAPEQKTEE